MNKLISSPYSLIKKNEYGASTMDDIFNNFCGEAEKSLSDAIANLNNGLNNTKLSGGSRGIIKNVK